MKNRGIIWLASVALAHTLGATTLYEQNAPCFGCAGWVSDWSPGENGARAFDNFTLLQQSELTGAQWVAFALPPGQGMPKVASNTTHWEISFWADNGFTPGSLVYSETKAVADVTATFLQEGFFGNVATDVYRYSFSLSNPLVLDPSVTYWFSALSHGDNLGSSAMVWQGTLEGTPVPNGEAYQQGLDGSKNVTNGVTQTAFGLAFAIEGNAIPEPGTWALLIAGLGLMGVFRARRRALR